MTIEIKIFGEAKDVLNDLQALLRGGDFTTITVKPLTGNEILPIMNGGSVGAGTRIEDVAPAKSDPEKKTRKAKEEKVAEPKAEVLAPEKPKYTLQDAIDRAREIAGDGKDEKIMNALKGINTRLGISKVREIPPEKLDGYMKELNAEFPKEAAATSANMFD